MRARDEMMICNFLARKMTGESTEDDKIVSELTTLLRKSSDFVVQMVLIRAKEILEKRGRKKRLEALYR